MCIQRPHEIISSQSHSQFVCHRSLSLPHNLSFSLSKISIILLSHHLMFPSSLYHSLYVALIFSLFVFSHHLIQLLPQFPSFSPKSLLPLYLLLTLTLTQPLSLLFYDLPLSFPNISPFQSFSLSLFITHSHLLFSALKHSFSSSLFTQDQFLSLYLSLSFSLTLSSLLSIFLSIILPLLSLLVNIKSFSLFLH